MMKKIYTLAIVLLVLGVSSCKLGKHYSRPELRLPEQIEGTVPDSVSAGDIRWADLYTDPVLRQLIRKTLEGNKDLMIAAAKVKESMELRRIAKADLFPKAEATVSAEREYDETPGNTFEGKVLAILGSRFVGKTTLGRSGRSGRIFAERRRQAGFAVGSGCPGGAGLFRVDRFRSGTGHRTADTGGPAGRSTSGKAQVRGRIDFRKSLASGTGRIGQNPNPGTGIRKGDSPQRESDYFTGRRISRRSGEREKYRSAAVDDRSAGGIIFPNSGKTGPTSARPNIG